MFAVGIRIVEFISIIFSCVKVGGQIVVVIATHQKMFKTALQHPHLGLFYTENKLSNKLQEILGYSKNNILQFLL